MQSSGLQAKLTSKLCEHKSFRRLRRLFYFSFMLLFHCLFRICPNFLRRYLLKFVGAKVSANVFISATARFDFPWRLSIGRNCYINDRVYFDCRGGRIVIADNCDISADVKLYTLSHDHRSVDMAVKKGTIFINCRVWLCTRSIILPSVRIGEGSVVGANCVISKSLMKNSIAKISTLISTDDGQANRASNINRQKF